MIYLAAFVRRYKRYNTCSWPNGAEICREREGVDELMKQLHIDGQKQPNTPLKPLIL
jgi:hypothetical protein